MVVVGLDMLVALLLLDLVPCWLVGFSLILLGLAVLLSFFLMSSPAPVLDLMVMCSKCS